MSKEFDFSFYEEEVVGVRRVAVVREEWNSFLSTDKEPELARAMGMVVGQFETKHPIRHLRELDALKLAGAGPGALYAGTYGSIGVIFAAVVAASQRVTGIRVVRICELVSGQVSVADQRIAATRLSALLARGNK